MFHHFWIATESKSLKDTTPEILGMVEIGISREKERVDFVTSVHDFSGRD